MNTAEILLIDESRQISCKYYTMQDFKIYFYKSKGLHSVHYNARSLNPNMEKIVESLRQITLTFDIVAISETWTNENCIHYEIP